MKIRFADSEIECDASELDAALNALRTMAEIAPQGAPRIASNGAPVARGGREGDALNALLRAKTGKGTRYVPDGCHKGLTRVEAFKRECARAGIGAEEIEAALSAESNSGEVLDIGEVPVAGADDGGDFM